MKQLEIIDTDIDGIRVVAPVGEIDLATAPLLREHLQSLLANQPHHLVVRLDLVSFLDSSGVNALVAAYRRARAIHTEFRLAAPSDQVAKVLNITGVGTFIPTFTSLRDARKPLPSHRVVPAARTADHRADGRHRQHRQPAAHA